MGKTAGRYLIHMAVLWVVNVLSLGLGAWITPGIHVSAANGIPAWLWLMTAAVVLAVVNLVVRPIVLRFAMALGWVFTLVIGFLVNAVALWLTAWLLPGFDVGILSGLFGGIVIAFFNTIMIDVLNINQENSWYQNRIERLAEQDSFSSSDEPGRGLMMVEIDGLSYWHIQKAIDEGLMPALAEDAR